MKLADINLNSVFPIKPSLKASNTQNKAQLFYEALAKVTIGDSLYETGAQFLNNY